jgi:lysophospholipase L1-like esterase
VGLGDSIAGAGHCGAGCRSYVLVLGELAATALGDSVDTVNLASNNDLGSGGLRSLVESDAPIRDALAAADVVTIGIGWNDWQGPCFWDGLQACLENNQDKVEENLDATLGEIGRIRDGKPTAIRVVTYANPFPGDPQTTSYFNLPADVPIEDLQAMLSEGLASFNAMLCSVAERQEGACVDLVPVFNGSKGDQPIEDALRGSQAQMDLIAKTIDAAGYAPLP